MDRELTYDGENRTRSTTHENSEEHARPHTGLEAVLGVAAQCLMDRYLMIDGQVFCASVFDVYGHHRGFSELSLSTLNWSICMVYCKVIGSYTYNMYLNEVHKPNNIIFLIMYILLIYDQILLYCILKKEIVGHYLYQYTALWPINPKWTYTYLIIYI